MKKKGYSAIQWDVDGYLNSYHDHKSVWHREIKLKKKPVKKTTKQKAQQMLNDLNKDKEVRKEFDKLVRLEKLKNLK